MRRTKFLTDYQKYRGKCKEMSEALAAKNLDLRIVRGWYFDALWGQQEHWWCEDKEGNIHDPTKRQFPSKGSGQYVEFDGFYSCEQCGERIHVDNAYFEDHHIFCSGTCFRRCVGL